MPDNSTPVDNSSVGDVAGKTVSIQAAEVSAAIELNGLPLDSSRDVARFLGVPHSQMLYVLYKASDDARYVEFEIPKRTGGMRTISSPNGVLRKMQERLAPALTAAYNAHPNAHGFIGQRSILTNAEIHAGQNLVLNVDLADFFPSVNFGRVRGLFMAEPFLMGKAAATVMAQICTHKNGLPQGAPTSPVLSNFVAATLDRRLTRLGRANRMKYSRYADDITFSTNQPRFPVGIVMHVQSGGEAALFNVVAGPSLEREIAASGFEINAKKVRLQTRHVRQSVTGLNVNSFANVDRRRIRRVRAMFHAWEKFGIEAAARHHFRKHGGVKGKSSAADPARGFRNAVYGELAFLKMVRGADDPVFLKLMSKLIALDPTPSKFVRQMVFGADDFDIFISHAREDRETIARPIFEACARRGLKAFLDEEHIGWGQSFTTKINTALGAARTVIAVVTPTSVTKEWPLEEMNTALSLEIAGKKQVLALMVGRPDLSKLPLMERKNWLDWGGDADEVARRLDQMVRPPPPVPRRAASSGASGSRIPGPGAGLGPSQGPGQGSSSQRGSGGPSTPVTQGGGKRGAGRPGKRTWRAWLFGN